ncbi:chaplin, partial [Streptomyces sp. SID5910]|uniref:chaplin n=1 Tax=Streptomyces sp. SID5910 TaxID=2690312 RepID=UPI001368BC31
MRQTLSRGVFAAAAATGILSLSGTPALADSIAVGATDDASGLLSGNNVQAPIDVPVNVCGNTIGVLAVGNGTHGNECGNGSHGSGPAGAQAVGHTEDASGIASGNNIQAPVHVPVNLCGNAVNVLAVGNDTHGNDCGNGSGGNAPAASASTSASSSAGGARAVGHTEDSYGLLAGNNIQAPIHLPVNVCGNAVNVLAVGNDTYGNDCGNEGGYGTEEEVPPTTTTPVTPTTPTTPSTPSTPSTPLTPPASVVDTPPAVAVDQPAETPQLAETGSAGMLTASVAG